MAEKFIDFYFDEEGKAVRVDHDKEIKLIYKEKKEADKWKKRMENGEARMTYWVPIKYIILDGTEAMSMKEQPAEGDMVLCTNGLEVWPDVFKDGGFFQSNDATAWMRMPIPYKHEDKA